MLNSHFPAKPLARRRGQRGAALLTLTLMVAAVLLPLIGLAIDGALLYWVRARLSSAVDAAALAAGRALNAKVSTTTNSGNAVATGNRWFSANFPAGWLGTSVVGGAPTITLQQTTSITQQVNVSAQVTVPLFFMRILGPHFQTATVSANSQSSRRNLFMILVLDRSGSLAVVQPSLPPGTNETACAVMQAASINFLSRFTENFDTLGLVTFSTDANGSNGQAIDFPPSQTFITGMTSVIKQISCTGGTNAAEGLNAALKAIQANGLQNGLNVVIFFTDGQPNGMTTKWPWNWQSDGGAYRYNPIPNPYPNFQLYQANPSPCSLSSMYQNGGVLKGSIVTAAPQSNPQPILTGYTEGLYDPTATVAVNSVPPLVQMSGCSYMTNGSAYIREDVAYIWPTDLYQNNTGSGYLGAPPYKPVDLFQGGTFQGKMRIDEQINGLIAASTNAADNQAQAMLHNATYPIMIDTIGLGGAPDMPVDQVLLQRMANDPASPIYNPNLQTGMFKYASDQSALDAAFQQVAAQILRLSQ